MRWDSKPYYNALNARMEGYVDSVNDFLDDLCGDMEGIVGLCSYNGGDPFSFADFPELNEAVAAWTRAYATGMTTIVNASTSAEWTHSNECQDALATKYLDKRRATIAGRRRQTYFKQNPDALKAFQQRQVGGLKLSRRLWYLAGDLKGEMEAGISLAINRGTSAVTLSKQLSQYLHDFPKLKADYGQKYGNAADIHDCEYRSARVARTEINMAYRKAEQTRWQQMDFVLGKEIKLSGRHPCDDICDELAGEYPKEFDWAGWHPNCMCYEVPILRPLEDDDNSAPMITEMPTQFCDWVERNANGIALAKGGSRSMPYFIRDNIKTVNSLLRDMDLL